MKLFSHIAAGALLGALLAPAAFAQTAAQSYDPSAPKTRAEVKADLVAWRAAGYDPLDWIDYPVNAQQAGAIVAARRAQSMGAGATPATSQQ
ncbi:DUF4148 domain-containing protein [Paraburkholderia saeva]|uniref:DUF4148 domain-containing protein n=1 Tax=Paraburkholderia saeva TaxID=2777537 RepID=A0A9N8S0Q4_9BURK|nr:DUF4148 domain-containing protein [Paraburkholderia saeva]CAG4912267.1 hypothetical protein R70241_04014 [Paraburkholderia saeva]CAG4924554.1 hypothetical protein LMG31841_05396 [Paraburkholderia saeva]